MGADAAFAFGGAVTERLDATIGDLFDIASGEAPGRFRVRHGAYALLGANGEIGRASQFNFERGYLVGRVGASGMVNRVDRPVWASDNALTAKPRLALVDFDYAGHLLKALELEALATRTAQPLLTQTNLKRLPVQIPRSRDVQAAIASVLNQVDQLASTTSEAIRKHGLIRAGIVRSIGAQADAAWTPLADVADVITGTTPSSSAITAWGRGLAFVTPGDVPDVGDVIDSTVARRLSVSGVRLVRLVPAGSVLVVCIGSTVGKVAISRRPCATNQQINAVVPWARLDSDYVAAAIVSQRRALLSMAALQAVPLVNKSRLSALTIPIAPQEDQVRMGNLLRAIDVEAAGLEARMAKLSELRVGLVRDLILRGRPAAAEIPQ